MPHARRGTGHYVPRGDKRTDGDLYLLPHWPYYTQFFQDNDLIKLSLGFDTASQAYAGRGGNEDLSKLIFGENPVLIKEILLASKLASGGQIISIDPLNSVDLAQNNNTQRNHFLGILADQEVVFDASLDQYHASVDYARHFRDGDLTIGFHVPLKMRKQHLKLVNDLSQDNLRKLKNIERGRNAADTADIHNLAATDQLQFFKKFSNLDAFVTEILSRKGIALNKKETILGLSDVVAYANLDIPSSYVDRFVTGISVLMPTSRERDTGKLWYTDMGNGGFIETAGYGSFLWQRSRWFNPHVHVKATYLFAANVYRRVPMVNKFDGTNFNGIPVGVALPVNSRMIFGETFTFIAAQTFATSDSTIRGFADQSRKVKVQPGPQFFARFGNTFDAIFSDKGFVDLYYDLFFKGKDYMARRRTDDVYQPTLLSHNTAAVSHTAGLTYSYQFDDQFRARLGANYVIAGRNTPKTFGVEVSLNAEF